MKKLSRSEVIAIFVFLILAIAVLIELNRLYQYNHLDETHNIVVEEIAYSTDEAYVVLYKVGNQETNFHVVQPGTRIGEILTGENFGALLEPGATYYHVVFVNDNGNRYPTKATIYVRPYAPDDSDSDILPHSLIE